MKAIAFIKKNSMLLLAGAAIIAFSAFKISENKVQSSLTFKYEAPAGDPNPFSDTNVKNTAHWKLDPTNTPCPTTINQVACSISVPIGNTMNDEQELDPTKVQISTLLSSTNNYRVVNGTGYSSPVNKAIP